jgi:hypothetical protein
MYPLNIKLLNNSFSPLILGKDFFSIYNWSHSAGENIKTPKCDLIVKCDKYGNYLIDNELSGQVFKSEEIKQQGGTSRKKIAKLHKYFGHASAKHLWRVLRHSSSKDDYSQAEIKEVCNNCSTCTHSKRKMARKETSLPRATGFNQVITMDLKGLSDGRYFLWLVDDATRMIRGQVMADKNPDTVIDALERAWINGRGIGPGLPEKHFFCDNGREFINEKLLSMAQRAGITIEKTASYSPQ